MNAVEAIRVALDTSEMISMAYLDDLSDEEMMLRPTPNANHIKWQLGHLIVSENQMINACLPGALPELPEGFADRYAKDKSNSDDALAFDSKADLLLLYRQQREATKQTLDRLSPEELDTDADESIRSYSPTIGATFIMQDTHWMMHAGQWAIVRRMLGRDPLF